MIIAIDFDGTCVTHEFPNVGKNIGAESVLKELVSRGHQLILFTMRSDNGDLPLITPEGIEKTSGDFLQDAINWFKEHDIPLYGIQTNPAQDKWTKSPKAYAHLYIDDAALGCPLKENEAISDRPFVDWDKVRTWLIQMALI